jgi:hypothetical protein
MASIDKFLHMMAERHIERAVLAADRPFQLIQGGQKSDGPVLSASNLNTALKEITPPHFLPHLEEGGTFHFVHYSPDGGYNFSVENYVGALEVTVTPSAQVSSELFPQAPTLQAPFPTAAWSQPVARTSAPPGKPVVAGPACIVHPDRAAAGVCAYSGKFYCGEDLVEFDGKQYGKENLSRVFAEAKTQANSPAMPMVFMNSGGASSSSSAPVVTNTNTTLAPTVATSVAVASAGDARLSKPRNKWTTLILCLAGCSGVCGLHRFYTGHTGTGVLQFFTFGGLALWQIVDCIAILTDSYRDADGQRLA